METTIMAEYERFKYENAPLIEVTFQVNFPTILAIEANEPVEFQQYVMKKFPNYDSKTEYQSEVTVNLENEKADVSASMGNHKRRKLHIFVSEDQKWKITLAKDMVAFTTVDYKYWEDMAARTVDVIKALVESYHPLYFNRVGIRYIDAIDRSVYGVEDVPWCELLQPHICGSFSYQTDEDVKVRGCSVGSEIAINDIYINYTSGTGLIDRHDGTMPHEAFILNCDYYYSKKTNIDGIGPISEKLHLLSHKFFRESITDRLHKAMHPEELIV
jgi:uncharacterized protein (TIGR04255 family)